MEWKKAHKFLWFFFLFWVHDAEHKLHHICAPNISVGWEICQSSPSQYAATHISANPSGGARVVCGTCHSLFRSHQLSDGSILAHCRSLHATLGYFHVCVSNKSCSPGSSFLHSHDIVLLGFNFAFIKFIYIWSSSSKLFFHFARSFWYLLMRV